MHYVFETEHKIFTGRDADDKSIVEWVKQLAFYSGGIDPITLDPTKDWRFCEVKDRRRVAIFKGQITSLTFPVVYPLVLDNSVSLDGYKQLAYDDTDEVFE